MTATSDKIFTLIENGSVAEEMRVRDSDVTVTAGPVRHAVDRRGRRHLLIPLGPGQSALDDRTSRGVTATERELVDGRHRARFLDIACELVDLRDVFAVFCDDLLRRLETEPGPPSGVCAAVLERWRDLLTPATSTLLGPTAQLALLAELHFMELVAAQSPASAVRLWTGQDRARTDFTGINAAVEVKATTRRDRIAVEIHGLRQLDPGQLDAVYLHVEQMEQTPVGGDSLPDAVSRLLAADIDRNALLRGLTACGYQATDAAVYHATRFTTISSHTFCATADGFPRLVPSALADPTLAQRIFGVSYSIDVTDVAAVPGRLPGPETAVEHLVRGTG